MTAARWPGWRPSRHDTPRREPRSRAILEGLIERDLATAEVVAEGYDSATVARVWRMLENAEYKRRQAPTGVKIISRSISRDRGYPITNAFRGND